jgi:outer membrane protein OmpA-like peptidoglycan-associated protein
VLLTNAKGQATVESRQGHTEIDAKLENLTTPTRFGREYLTYVLWAISPEGAAHNLGEIIADASDRARLRVTTDLQAFGLIVTAEPYAAVRQPSSVVVLENKSRPDTAGKIEPVKAKADLLPRRPYTWQVSEGTDPAQTNAPKVSMSQYEAVLELYQAQNAVGIARAANAERYAPEAFAKAQQSLNEAQRLQAVKANTKLVVAAAREATQTAEDARVMAESRKQAEQRSRPEAGSEPARDHGASGQAERSVDSDAPTQVQQQLLERLSGPLAARPTPRGIVVALPGGAFDGVALRPSASAELAPVVSAVAALPGLRVEVEGHAGSEESELIAWQRAEAVQKVLVTAGLPASLVSIRGFGSSQAPAGASLQTADSGVEMIISDNRSAALDSRNAGPSSGGNL